MDLTETFGSTKSYCKLKIQSSPKLTRPALLTEGPFPILCERTASYSGEGYGVDFGDLYATADRSRIELLTLELDLAFNFARLAQQQREPHHRERSLQCALIALGAIRRFEGQISDPAAWKLIHERADELERLLERVNT